MLNSLINQHLGRYQISALLGRGGMAVVYRAHDAVLQRDVALKVLYPQYTDEQTQVERFKREAITAAGLDHPNIVPMYDVGEHDGLVYIAMKLLSGYSLYDVLNQRGALPLAELLPVLEQVASALDYAHKRGVVHRDIKPGNIILELPHPVAPRAAAPVAVARDAPTAQGVLPAIRQPLQQPDLIPPGTLAILTDFGIAKSLDTPGLTTTGAMLGTPDYMAPEQISGGRVDRRTDVYALGVLVYRALTGQRPFGGATQDVLLSHLHTMPDDPSLVNPHVAPALDAVILRAMAKQPAARYGSAGEFVQALRAASTGLFTSVPTSVPLAEQTTRPTQPRTRPDATPHVLARLVTQSPVQALPRQRQSNSLLLAGLVVALLLIAGGLIANGAARLFGGSGQVVVAQPTATQAGAGVAILPTESPTASATRADATTTMEVMTPSAQPASPTRQATVATEGSAPSVTPVIVKQTVVVTQPPPPPATKTQPPQPSITSSPAPAPPTDTVAPTATIPPPTETLTPAPAGCDESPLRQGSGFKVLYEADISVRGKLGCPANPGGEKAGKAADQVFASGTMYWWETLDTVYALPESPNRTGTFRTFNKAEAAALPDPPAEINPKMNAQGGFARVYYAVPDIRDAIGAPVTTERPIAGAYQAFEHGIMIYSPANDTVRAKTIYVLYNDGTFKRFDDLNPN